MLMRAVRIRMGLGGRREHRPWGPLEKVPESHEEEAPALKMKTRSSLAMMTKMRVRALVRKVPESHRGRETKIEMKAV